MREKKKQAREIMKRTTSIHAMALAKEKPATIEFRDCASS
jgi:hypothetical protein